MSSTPAGVSIALNWCKREESVTDMAPATEENRGAYVCGIDDLRLGAYKLPESLGPAQVRVRIKAVGICGSDVHYVKHMKLGAFEVKKPMVIGHESSGVIEEVGAEVQHLAVGDRVALEPGVPCWKCSYCKQGLYNLCPDMEFFATPPVHGSLADQVVHPANLCFKLPDNVSLEEGAMCEPLSVGVHACRRAQVGPETSLLIVGGGPIGLMMLLVARAFGSPRILLADTHQERLQCALALGADETVLLSKDPGDAEREMVAMRTKMGRAIDVACDCVGTTKSLAQCLDVTRAAGRVCVVGMRESHMTLPITEAVSREVDLVGVFRYRNTYPMCLDLISSGRVDVKPLITHRYKFTEQYVKAAFETSSRGVNAIKVMFNL